MFLDTYFIVSPLCTDTNLAQLLKKKQRQINRFRVIASNKLIQLVFNEEEREEVGGR